MHCAAPVGVELIALLIWLRGDDVKAHVLHIGFQGSLMLGVLPSDLQAMLFSAIYDGNLQVQQALSEIMDFLRGMGWFLSAVCLNTPQNGIPYHMTFLHTQTFPGNSQPRQL